MDFSLFESSAQEKISMFPSAVGDDDVLQPPPMLSNWEIQPNIFSSRDFGFQVAAAEDFDPFLYDMPCYDNVFPRMSFASRAVEVDADHAFSISDPSEMMEKCRLGPACIPQKQNLSIKNEFTSPTYEDHVHPQEDGEHEPAHTQTLDLLSKVEFDLNVEATSTDNSEARPLRPLYEICIPEEEFRYIWDECLSSTTSVTGEFEETIDQGNGDHYAIPLQRELFDDDYGNGGDQVYMNPSELEEIIDHENGDHVEIPLQWERFDIYYGNNGEQNDMNASELEETIDQGNADHNVFPLQREPFGTNYGNNGDYDDMNTSELEENIDQGNGDHKAILLQWEPFQINDVNSCDQNDMNRSSRVDKMNLDASNVRNRPWDRIRMQMPSCSGKTFREHPVIINDVHQHIHLPVTPAPAQPVNPTYVYNERESEPQPYEKLVAQERRHDKARTVDVSGME